VEQTTQALDFVGRIIRQPAHTICMLRRERLTVAANVAQPIGKPISHREHSSQITVSPAIGTYTNRVSDFISPQQSHSRGPAGRMGAAFCRHLHSAPFHESGPPWRQPHFLQYGLTIFGFGLSDAMSIAGLPSGAGDGMQAPSCPPPPPSSVSPPDIGASLWKVNNNPYDIVDKSVLAD
jgi:hypothetical protein